MAILTAEAINRRLSRASVCGVPDTGDHKARMISACIASVEGIGLNMRLKIASSVILCNRGATIDRVTVSRCRDATVQRTKSSKGARSSLLGGKFSHGLYPEANLSAML